MSIANEITNYANGLSDAYDAVNDMQGLIPQDKNMNNLDTAIRTIPQSLGPTYTAGNGIDITNDVISIDDTVVAELTDLPTKTSELQNDGSDGTSTYVEADDLATVATSGDYTDLINTPTIPTVNDATLTITQNGTSAGTFTANSSADTTIALTDTTYSDFTGATSLADGAAGLVPKPLAGDETKFLSGNGLWTTVSQYSLPIASANDLGGIKVGTNLTIDANTGVLDATDTTYSAFTGATTQQAGVAGLVPAPAAGDQSKVLHGDGTWKDATAKLVEMSYGESNAWAKFIAAYNAGSIVYCRASSNANPGTGSQTRKAFMAYVNNATSPTSVEFQYVRSQSSKTDSQQCDQVFVYTLTNASGGTWSVASRNMAPKINVDGPITKTFTTGANATLTIGASAMTGATSSTAGAAGFVPAPSAGDQDKVLSGAGTWVAQSGGGSTYTAGNHIDITNDVISAIDYISADSPTAAVSPSSPVTTPMIADGAVTSAKIATGVVPQITMTNVDPGEGTPLAANNFVAVYDTTGSLLDMFYPVGSYYETSNTSFNPNTAWGGTWVEDSAGFVTVAKNSGTFATVGDTGGIENTNHAFWRPPLNSGNFQDPGQNYVGDIEARVNSWLQTGGSSTLTLSTTVAGKGGTIRTNGTANTECGFFKYTSTTLQPYVVVKRWHRTA